MLIRTYLYIRIISEPVDSTFILESSTAGSGSGSGFSVQEGPQLLYAAAGQCLVKMDSKTVLLTGGWHLFNGQPFLGQFLTTLATFEDLPNDPMNVAISQGPYMYEGRSKHSCGMIKSRDSKISATQSTS